MRRVFFAWRISFFIIGWLCATGVVADIGAFAQESPANALRTLEARKAEAAKLFDAVIAAHQALPAYRATVTMTTNILGQPNAVIKVRAKGECLLMHIETDEGKSHIAYAGGRLLLFSTKNQGKYVVQPVNEKPSLTNCFVVANGGVISVPQVLSLWGEWNPLENENENQAIREVQITNDADGKQTTIQITKVYGSSDTFQMTCTFDRASYRLASFRRTFNYGPQPVVITETVTDFSPDVHDDDLALTPPADARRIELPAPEPLYHPALKKGGDPLPIEATDMEGKAVSLKDYQGKVVLLNFWATWCGPCIAKFPFMTALEEKFGTQGFVVLGVACDEETEVEKVRAALKKHNVAWRNILHTRTEDGTPIAERYRVKGLPFLILIGRDGKIIEVGVNPGRSLEKLIERSIAADSLK
ncbi:MAG: TlpA family protein disulfide reductase [Chloracidobacterium sp.]|nr:TlpA family protein disulfide reductase [Chloracidobacterium sp.]MDW8218331.1 TlpA disulfide reductase family protein [Acidobacteriota bacterium]